MTVRAILLATVLLAATAATALGQEAGRQIDREIGQQDIMPTNKQDNAIAAPVLRADVTVTSDVVRIGDVIDNAGTAAQIAIYRAPDLGTTGSLPTSQLLAALQAHQVIGVDTRDIKAVSVTRSSRPIEAKDIQSQVAHALEHRSGLGDAANLQLAFDRDLQDVQLDARYTGDMQAVSTRYEPRTGRFDVSFEISSDNNTAPTRLRFTGTAIETVEAAVLTRDVQRTEILKSSDVITERRPKAEIGGDAAARTAAVGMQMRRQVRAGQALRTADLAKPDLVQRDDNVTLIYETAGIYLTIRGKALDGGTEGDVVGVMNLQSKRTISGVVIGRDQVAIQVATPRLPAPEAQVGSIDNAQVNSQVNSQVAASNSSPVTPKAE